MFPAAADAEPALTDAARSGLDESDVGGDPPCWAHLFEEHDATPATVIYLEQVGTGAGGAVWSPPHGGDLDANLVRFRPEGNIPEHINDDVDVLVLARSGSGEVVIDGLVHPLRVGVLALVPEAPDAGSLPAPTGSPT